MIASSSSTFQYGANFKIKGKEDPGKLSYPGAFSPTKGSFEDLAAHINKGHPWMPALVDRGKRRYQGFCNQADLAALDIDGGLTIQEALGNPFITQHCGLGIESASSTPENHKFRLVFRYFPDTQPHGYQEIRACNQYLMKQLAASDPACKDASRFFFGAPDRIPFLLQATTTLPETFVAEALAWHQAEEAKAQKDYQEALERRKQYQQNDQDKFALVQEALQFIPPRQPGSGTYEESIRVLMALVNEFGEQDAIALAETWSPSTKDWNIARKVAGMRRGSSRPVTIGTLFHIAQQHGFKFPTPQQEADRREAQRRAEGRITFHRDPEKETERDELDRLRAIAEPNPEQYRAHVAQEEERYKQEIQQIQAELNGLRVQPTIKESGLYIPEGLLQLPAKPGIILLDGTMGVRKTSVGLKFLVKQHRHQYPQGLEWLFVPRRLLGLQAGKELELPHHTQHKPYSNRFQGSGCFESIGAIALEGLPDAPPLILIDEASQAFSQILEGNTCRDSQAFVISRFRELCRAVANRGGWIALSEDGLTNLELDFVSEASGLNVVEFLQFTKTVTTPREYTVYDRSEQTWAEIERRLAAGENLVIPTDSQKWLEETGRWLEGLGINATLIDRNSSGESWVNELAENPNGWVYSNRPRVLGYSPTIGAGVSITDPEGWFDAVGFHYTHLEPRQAKQMGDRLRTDVPRFGDIKKRGATTDNLYSNCRPDAICRNLRRNAEGVEKITQFAEFASREQNENRDLLAEVERLRGDWNNSASDFGFYLKYWSQYKARETYNKLSLQDGLIAIWEGQGHHIRRVEEECDCTKELTNQRSEIRKELDREEAIAWVEANTGDLTVQSAKDTLNTLGATQEERRAARKRLMEDKLPGAPLDSVDFVLKTIIQKNGRFLKTTELLWLAQNPTAAKQLDQWTLQNTFTQSAKTGQFVIAHRLPVRSAQAKLLHECPLQPFIEGKITQWHNLTPEAIAVHQWAVLHRRQLSRYLRLTIKEEHTPVQTLNKILKHLGFQLEGQGWYGRTRQTKGERIYAISNLEDQDREAILKALTERFLSRCQTMNQEAVIATRRGWIISTSCDHTTAIDPRFFEFDSLKAIRSEWESTESEEERSILRQIYPPEVLEMAIAS